MQYNESQASLLKSIILRFGGIHMKISCLSAVDHSMLEVVFKICCNSLMQNIHFGNYQVKKIHIQGF